MSERLDAHVLEFRPWQPPAWRVWPKHNGESDEVGRPGSGSETLPGPRAVLAEPGEASVADVTKSVRVLRVRSCSACGTWYGAYYPAATVAEDDAVQHTCQHCCRPCEFLDHLPNRHGECRALVVSGATGETRELVAGTGAAEVPTRCREALGPAQQELPL